MKRTALLIIVLGFATAASAQQFRWVDKDGRVQYGDVPPPGAKVTRLKPPPTGSAPAPASAAKKDAQKPLSPEAAFQKRQKEAKEEADKAGKERAEADVRNWEELVRGVPRLYLAHLRSMAVLAQGKRARAYLEEAAELAAGMGMPGELWPICALLGELDRAAAIVQALADKIDDGALRAAYLAGAAKELKRTI